MTVLCHDRNVLLYFIILSVNKYIESLAMVLLFSPSQPHSSNPTNTPFSSRHESSLHSDGMRYKSLCTVVPFYTGMLPIEARVFALRSPVDDYPPRRPSCYSGVSLMPPPPAVPGSMHPPGPAQNHSTPIQPAVAVPASSKPSTTSTASVGRLRD